MVVMVFLWFSSPHSFIAVLRGPIMAAHAESPEFN